MEQLARAQQWISSLNTPTSPSNDLTYNSYFNKSAPNSSSNSQSLSRNASIYGQSPVNRPPNFHLSNPHTAADQQAYIPDQHLNHKPPSDHEYGNKQQAYDAEQAAYDQDKAAYDYAVYNHEMQLYNYQQQQIAAQQAAAGGAPTSPVSSHNTSFFYDNAIPPYPHIYQNQQQVY